MDPPGAALLDDLGQASALVEARDRAAMPDGPPLGLRIETPPGPPTLDQRAAAVLARMIQRALADARQDGGQRRRSE